MKKVLIAVLALSLLGAGCIGDTKVPAPNPAKGRFDAYDGPAEGELAKAYITNIKGVVTSFPPEGHTTPTKQLKNGDFVNLQQRIEVASGGGAEIVVPYYGKIFLDSGSSIHIWTLFPLMNSYSNKTELQFDIELLSGRIWVNLDRTASNDSGSGMVRITVPTETFFQRRIQVSTNRASFGLDKTENSLKVSSVKSTLVAYRYRLVPNKFPIGGASSNEYEGPAVHLKAGQAATFMIPGTEEADVSKLTEQELADPFVKRATVDIAWEEVAPTVK